MSPVYTFRKQVQRNSQTARQKFKTICCAKKKLKSITQAIS